ncbi:hypothetical protein [Hahella sp. NBU794]|uniref:hypothetical protein n=1 Tax=Hahella sp. NBU794 TaxID=3422590 RepID=UPI003D6F856E
MNLKQVCETLLDNADMRIDLSAFPKVTLDILVYGTMEDKYWKAVFECGQVVYMDAELDDDSSSNDLFVVLETRVKETTKSKVTPSVQHRMNDLQDDDPVWEVHLYGGMSLTLITTKFDWKLVELAESEYNLACA